MLTQEDCWMIRELHERGLYRKDIADRLGVHPKTVTRALKQGYAPSRRRRRQKYVKLKPYMGRNTRRVVQKGYSYRRLRKLPNFKANHASPHGIHGKGMFVVGALR